MAGRQAILNLVADASRLKKTLNDAADDTDSFSKKVGGHMGSMGGAIAGAAKSAAMVGIPALIGFGAAAVKAAAESEQVMAQTSAVIKSTGGAAKVTGEQISSLAGKLSEMSGVDDELIQSGENVLLTFTNIKNGVKGTDKIFDMATATALDMSVALGTDLSAANIQLGKALNDPIKGISALSKVGVSFTAAQKEQIKALVESGDVMGAQKIILGELQTEFGGSAKAAGDTFAGSIGKLKVMVGNFTEDVGAKLIPILVKLGEMFAAALQSPAVKSAVAWFQNAFKMMGYAIAAFRDGDLHGVAEVVDNIFGNSGRLIQPIEGFLNFFRDTFNTVKSIIGEVVAGFQSGGDGIGQSTDRLKGIITQLKETFSSAFEAIKAIVVTAADFLKGVWRVFGDDILSFIREKWASIQEVFRGALNFITGIFDLIKAVLTGKWGEAWTAMKKIIDGAWDAIFGVIRDAVTNTIPTIIAGLGQAITSVARTAFDGLKEHARAAFDWILERIRGVFDEIKKIPGKLLDAVPGAGLAKGAFKALTPFASGGIVTRPTAAMLGESGPEAVIPLSKMGSMGGGGTTVVQLVLDGRVLSSVVLDGLNDQKRRTGRGLI